jgi:lipoyl(octanoyl) transferase
LANAHSEEEQIVIEDWGLIPYREAFAKQDQYVREVIAGERKETLVFCSHPPIVTLGRGTKEGDVFSWAGDTFEVNRGGRATYHGPSQLVMYPIISLDNSNSLYAPKKTRPRDLHEYLRVLEESVVVLLRDFSVQGEGHSLQTQVGKEEPEEATGVWVSGRKIASIGVAVRKWVTSHGVALNLNHDGGAFQGMHPCGFKTNQMTDLESVSDSPISRPRVQTLWGDHFLNLI